MILYYFTFDISQNTSSLDLEDDQMHCVASSVEEAAKTLQQICDENRVVKKISKYKHNQLIEKLCPDISLKKLMNEKER